MKEKVSIFTFEPYVGLSTGFVLNKVNEINRLFVESDPEVGYRKDNTFSAGTSLWSLLLASSLAYAAMLH